MPTDALVVLCTFPSAAKAAEIARTLVAEQLAACMNISEVRSIYAWEGAIEDTPEALGIVKTTVDRFAALKERIVALHPYEVPEVIALSISDGHAPYLAWLGSTR